MIHRPYRPGNYKYDLAIYEYLLSLPEHTSQSREQIPKDLCILGGIDKPLDRLEKNGYIKVDRSNWRHTVTAIPRVDARAAHPSTPGLLPINKKGTTVHTHINYSRTYKPSSYISVKAVAILEHTEDTQAKVDTKILADFKRTLHDLADNITLEDLGPLKQELITPRPENDENDSNESN